MRARYSDRQRLYGRRPLYPLSATSGRSSAKNDEATGQLVQIRAGTDRVSGKDRPGYRKCRVRDGCGERLRSARYRDGLDIEGQRMPLPGNRALC